MTDTFTIPKRERVICKDGFSMSVQASQYHYCSPREDVGPYHEIEVGYPSQIESGLLPYIECPDWESFDSDRPDYGRGPTLQVYPYVPARVVMEIIGKHGGMVEGELPPLHPTR